MHINGNNNAYPNKSNSSSLTEIYQGAITKNPLKPQKVALKDLLDS